MGKYYWTIFAIFVILTMASVATAGKVDTLVVGGDVQGKNGQNIDVTIQATGLSDVKTFIIGLNFNKSVLFANSAVGGSLTSSKDIFAQSADNNQGIMLAGVTNATGINGSGVLFVVNFKVIGNVNDTSSLQLTVSANDTSNNKIDTSTTKITSGVFTVVGTGTGTGITTGTVVPTGTGTGTAAPTGTGTATTITPLLGAYLFPTTGESSESWRMWSNWGHSPPLSWNSNYLPDYSPGFDPTTELYSSKNTSIIKKQLELMKYAGINFVISSWGGQDDFSNQALDIIFAQVLSSSSNPFPDVKFAISYSKDESSSIPKSEIIGDINYIKNKYMNSPYYLKIGGKPVFFVYNFSSNVDHVKKWSDIKNQTDIYMVLNTFDKYENVAGMSDSWYEYNTQYAFNQQGTYSAHISPGTHAPHYTPLLAREDFVRFENNVKALKDANVQFKLIESWNDWMSGTGIEPAQKINHDDVNGFTEMSSYPSYGIKYLEILNKYFGTATEKPSVYATVTATAVPTVTTVATTSPTTAPTTVAPTNPPGGGSGGNTGSSDSSGGGGGGGGGLASPEPFDNILKPESRENVVGTTPVSFKYSTKELGIYEVLATGTQSETVSIRIEILKGTSKLVTTPASGIVYKNVNMWMNYKRMKDAIVRFKVDNSWMNNNGLSENDIRLSRWDNNSKKWDELQTNMITKDDNSTSFEAKTDVISASFVINGIKKGVPTIGVTAKKIGSDADGDNLRLDNNDSSFKIGMFVSPSSFTSGKYTEILDKLKNNNVARIIVPVYEAKRGEGVHIFYTELKGLNISIADHYYSLDTLLTEAHNRNIEVFAEIASFGPDPVMPSDDQKQNLKKIMSHVLDNYADDKGMKVDGIYLDYVHYEDPYSAEGNTDSMTNFVKELSKEVVVGKSKLSGSVKSAHYESLLHIYLWPHVWPFSGPSDYYYVTRTNGQDYARLSRNLDFTSPIIYGKDVDYGDANYVGKVTKFVKENTDNGTRVIPNIQAMGETKENPNLQYVIESAKNNGASGINIYDYSGVGDSEWDVIKNIK